jgi:hypothetical protein
VADGAAVEVVERPPKQPNLWSKAASLHDQPPNQKRKKQRPSHLKPNPRQENGILYGVSAAAAVVGLITLIVVERGLAPHDVVALCMGLSNTFALSVGLLLMGYGLVEIPRETWKSSPEQLLKWCAHR